VTIRRMLAALYPEKWIPYRYLWPFLRNWWDSEKALREIARCTGGGSSSEDGQRPPRVLLLPAGKDEVIPAAEADYLETVCREIGLDTTRVDVPGALHNEASLKAVGRIAIVDFLDRL